MIIIHPHLTPQELVKLCKVSMRTVESWRHRGKGPRYIKLPNGQVRYPTPDALTYAGYDQEDISTACTISTEEQ